ncbi:MAG: HesA/MoeB/ThiF family protein [Spirochaetota bacterium]|nr:HesA/MoeB/ThiF family protein [Spirochaetota bacterium]
MLTEDEYRRYKRQLNISNWGEEAQNRLKDSTVLVAGAGGLGSPLLFYLSVAGVGTLKICDYDKIEPSNLNRQILHSDKDVGKYKVDSAYETLTNANPNTKVIKIYDKISKENIHEFIDKVDLIVDCLDNFQTRFIINELSVKKTIPLIHAGVSGFVGQITFLQPPETPCLACFSPQNYKKEEIPVLGATPGVIGSLQAIEAIKYLTGIGTNLKNRLLFWDGIDMSFRIMKLTKNNKCLVCQH